MQLYMVVDSLVIYKERTVPFRENSSNVTTLLMANIVWKILIPQIFIDFHDWKKRKCRRKLLLNVFHTSKNNMLLLTNCEVHTGKYLDRSFEVRTERSELVNNGSIK